MARSTRPTDVTACTEPKRLNDAREEGIPWKKWGPYLLERQWGTHDNGAGLGASHQTGWTGIVARLLDLFARVDANAVLGASKGRLLSRLVREQVGLE
jgi:hypothetical protein